MPIKPPKKSGKTKWFVALAVFILFILIFQLFALLQNNNLEKQKRLENEFRIENIETQKVIDAGIDRFTPSAKLNEWPGCSRPLGRDLTVFEMGYCDGAFLSFAWEGSASYDSEEVPKIIQSYARLTSAEDNLGAVCELATSLSAWKNVLYNHPKYKGSEIKLGSDSFLNSEYKDGCRLGIAKSFSLGKSQQYKWEKNKSRLAQNKTKETPASKSTKSSDKGRWVSKCRFVYVPNPNYLGDQNGVAQNLENPRYISEKQCTDVYVKN